MGGCHPTFLPDEALQYADAVVVGDAEGLWEQVVSDVRAGRLQRWYRQSDRPSLAGPPPDRRVFRGKRYAPISLLQFGRGCRFACDFCTIHALYGSQLRQRSIRDIVAEIEALNRKQVFLVDDNIFVDVPRFEELLEALVPLRIRWSCQVSLDVTSNARLLRLMQRSGCTSAVVGFESFDERNLAQMKKRWNLKLGDYATSIRKLQDHGIMIHATFVFGYDYDTPAVFDRTVDFALDSRFFLANFNLLTPTPGTTLYDRLRAEGRLIYERWWLAPGYRYGQSMFHPRGMTAEQLAEGCYRARTSFNTWSSIGRRALRCGPTAAAPSASGSISQPICFRAARFIASKDCRWAMNCRPVGQASSLPGQTGCLSHGR